MTQISTVAELDALPVGAEVADKDDDRWRKVRVERWEMVGATRNPVEETGFIVAYYSPFRPLASEPAPTTTHMVRCCAQGCPNTAALQPGSSYLCPDHGDGGCSENTITKGDRS